MAKCNLFKKLNTDGGTFLLFSQYTNDLTRQNADGDAYKVIPSRFAAFNIDYSSFSDNAKIPEVWQNYYENSCAFLRSQLTTDWKPEYAATQFWRALKFFKWEKDASNKMDKNHVLKYVGNVDVVATSNIDGDNYSETFVLIPNSAKENKYSEPSSATLTPVSQRAYTDSYIWRWTATTYPANALSHTPMFLSTETGKYSTDNSMTPRILDIITSNTSDDTFNYDGEPTNSQFFKTNTIVVFYDVVAKNDANEYTYIHKSIPMGIYFTGCKSGSTLINEITKYSTNEEIYGQGTSYGIRITTKWIASPAQTAYQESSGVDVSVTFNDIYPAFAHACDRMADAADTLLESIKTSSAFNDDILKHFNSFNGKKTNVPYIREINGEPYWFVNGRTTDVKVYPDSIDNTINNYLEAHIINSTIYTTALNAAISQLDNYKAALLTAISEQQRVGISYLSTAAFKSNRSAYLVDNGKQVSNNYSFQLIKDAEAEELFNACYNLEVVPQLDIVNATSLKSTFNDCTSLKRLWLPNSMAVKDFSYAFKNCASLESIYLDAESATEFESAFFGCSNLKTAHIANIKGKVVNDLTLDFTDTQLSLESLLYIIEHVQAVLYPDTQDPMLSHITIRVPNSNLDTSTYNVQEAVTLAYENKFVDIRIETPGIVTQID